MMPVIYRFDPSTAFGQVVLYLIALGLVAYAAVAGWRGALAKTKGEEPTQQDRIARAAMFGGGAVLLSLAGLYYALPSVPLIGQGKGEGVPIHTYGILVGAGFVTAVTLSSWLAKREWPGAEGEKKREQILDLAFYVFLGGIIGSRVLFILVNWREYAANPREIFSLGGGLVFYGGLIGAGGTAYWYCWKHKIEFLRLADLAIPTVSLGQCLGRLGCFAAGCCWGRVAKPGVPFPMTFPGPGAKNLFGGLAGTPSLAFTDEATDHRFVELATGKVYEQMVPNSVEISRWVAEHGHSLPVHPTQMYESIGQLVLLVVLLTLRRYRRFHGQIFGLWLMCYAVLRSTVELFRGDVARGTLHHLLDYLGMTGARDAVPLDAWYNVSVSQFISLCLFTVGAVILARKWRGVLARPVQLAAA
jgi:phosphatidylglycerol---prolipoprotein diacylglyceryl transferase